MEQLIDEIPAEESLYYRLEGRFSRPAVSKLRRWLAGDAAASVVLDVSHVDRLDDAPLALLMVNLVAIVRRRGKAVVLRGLRQHQTRMLAHFGIEFGEDGSIQPRIWRRSA